MEADGDNLNSDGLLRRATHFLSNRDFTSCRKWALIAREKDPNLNGLTQILAIAEVLIAAELRLPNGNFAYYPILQVRKFQINNQIFIRTQFKKFSEILNPSTNKFPFALEAFNHVCVAWGVLSDPEKKSQYDIEIVLGNELKGKEKEGGGTGKFEGFRMKKESSPEKGNSEGVMREKATFWTVCPYCFYLHEYEKRYEECCLRCQNCKRGFHGLAVAAPPDSMVVGGGNEYYCGYGVFPVGFSFGDYLGKKEADVGGSVNGKRDDFVVISDDDEMEVDVNGGGFQVKEEVFPGGEEGKRSAGRRVKSVARNTKKRMGRGLKKIEIEHMMEGSGNGCDDIDLEFFEGDGDIFVGIKGDG